MGIFKLGIALFCLLFIQIETTETVEANGSCPNDSLPCDDGECVSRGKWCDEEKNCQDESDEAYCKKRGWWGGDNPNNCEDAHFLCKNGHCIPFVGQCDGFEDCKDKSDEWNCEPDTFDDYDDYMLSTTTTVVPTETTTIKSSSESDELENDDIATTTQSSNIFFTQVGPLTSSTGSFYVKRIEQESIQTDMPHSTKPSTTTPQALPAADPFTRQFTTKSTVSTKSVLTTTLPNKAYESWRSTSKPFLISTRPSFDPRRQPSSPLPTSSSSPKLPYQSEFQSGLIQLSTSSHYPTRSFVVGNLPNSNKTQTSSSPDRGSRFLLSTQSPSYLEERRLPPFQFQTRSTVLHHTRRESYPTQPSISSSSTHIHPNLPISGFPKTRTDAYQHETQPVRPQESSRTISGNQQQNLPTSYYTRHQPYDNRHTRHFDSRQQPYDNRQQSYDNRQQPYDNRQQPYDNRQQPYDNRQQAHDNRQQPYDQKRNPELFQSQVSRPNSYLSQPTGQVGSFQYPHHIIVTGETINGFQIYRMYSSDGIRFYEGYYNQNGQFVTVNTNQRQGRYSQHSTAPPRRPRPQPLSTAPPKRTRPQPPTISTAAPVFFDGKLKAPSRFYFAKNYTRSYFHKNAESIEKGRDWILSIRDSEGGWGKETPRALIALSLITNNFANDTYENNIMQKYFQVFLGTSLIRGDTKTTNLNRLAMSVNALIATCQNPRDFHGTDFTELIRSRLREQLRENRDRRNGVQSVNPFVYLSLCLADRNLENYELHDLIIRLHLNDSPDEFELDKQTMAISAFTCHLQRQKAIYSSPSNYLLDLDYLLRNATSKLLERMRDDGSFGSVYSTAIAAQALMSVNDTKNWNPELTFNFLREHQKDNGSFGDFLATYLVLPALSGRSLLHLRNTHCTPPNSDRALTPTEILAFRGPKHHVRYSLFIGNPKTNGYSIDVLVPVGISFFDIMRVAAHKNDAFKFSFEEKDGGIHVYSISNVPNDSERGLEWNLFATRRPNLDVDRPESLEPIRIDIRSFYPRSDQHVIFWYKPSDKWT